MMKKLMCVVLASLPLLTVHIQAAEASAMWPTIREGVVLLKKLVKTLSTAEQKRRIDLYKKFRATKGHLVCLKVHKGQYISAGNLSLTLHANRSKCSIWEQFKITNGKTTLRHGDKVKILTYQNLYWSAQPVGTLYCNRTAAKAWEVFTIKKASGKGAINSGDKVIFLSHHNKYVSPEHGGGAYLVANRGSAQAWEQFQISWSPTPMKK
jgi:hypothetical protein